MEIRDPETHEEGKDMYTDYEIVLNVCTFLLPQFIPSLTCGRRTFLHLNLNHLPFVGGIVTLNGYVMH